MTGNAVPGWMVESDEVLRAAGPVAHIDQTTIDHLKSMARKGPRGRARLCAHARASDLVHEMVIALTHEAYVRPHRHLAKVESYHVIEGHADALTFDQEGRVVEAVPMGPAGSGRTFYYRSVDSRYHCFIVRSEAFVFHETTNGPFQPSETIFPSWAPEEKNREAVQAWRRRALLEARQFAP